MDSGRYSDSTSSEPPKGATLIATLIAVITLVLPLWSIAHYSSSSTNWISPTSVTENPQP